jgi:hypothetical protein
MRAFLVRLRGIFLHLIAASLFLPQTADRDLVQN